MHPFFIESSSRFIIANDVDRSKISIMYSDTPYFLLEVHIKGIHDEHPQLNTFYVSISKDARYGRYDFNAP